MIGLRSASAEFKKLTTVYVTPGHGRSIRFEAPKRDFWHSVLQNAKKMLNINKNCMYLDSCFAGYRVPKGLTSKWREYILSFKSIILRGLDAFLFISDEVISYQDISCNSATDSRVACSFMGSLSLVFRGKPQTSIVSV